jgi:hypothetical protein
VSATGQIRFPAFPGRLDALPSFPVPVRNFPVIENNFPVNRCRELPGNRCGTAAFRTDVAPKRPEIAKFPVIFPVSREIQAETGSYLTAHTTIQSPQTARFRYDAK